MRAGGAHEIAPVSSNNALLQQVLAAYSYSGTKPTVRECNGIPSIGNCGNKLQHAIAGR